MINGIPVLNGSAVHLGGQAAGADEHVSRVAAPVAGAADVVRSLAAGGPLTAANDQAQVGPAAASPPP